MAFKTFVAGNPLPASDLNTYLMAQANIVCTSTTRPASPPAGMVIYETDTNVWNYYDGTQWRVLSLQVQRALIGYSPGGAVDSPSGGVSWLNAGTITVPAFASAAYVQTFLTGVYGLNTTPDLFALSSYIGGQATPAVQVSGGINSANTGRFGVSWGEMITGLTAGTFNIGIRSSRVNGTSNFRADPGSRLSLIVDFVA